MAPNHPDHRPIGSRRVNLTPDNLVPPSGYGAPSPRRSGGGIFRRFVNLLLLIAALVVIGGIVWGVWSLAGGGSNVPSGRKVAIIIPKGANSSTISQILGDKGIIGNRTVFRARLKLHGDGTNFRSGTYTMKTGSSYNTVVRVLNQGPSAAPTYSITLPEGRRLEETAATIDQLHNASMKNGGVAQPAFTGAEYLKAARAIPVPPGIGAPATLKNKEGLLFPATYDMNLKATAADLVAKQQAAFATTIASLDMTRAKAANLTPYDIVIIASLAEREGRTATERSKIAAVIWNRLKQHMSLGIDASTQYSSYVPGSKVFWIPELKQSQLDKPSPYNLRLNTGLPPTPIAEPSLQSLQAAANPAKVNYLYYEDSSKHDGSLFFTDSYNAFLAEQHK